MNLKLQFTWHLSFAIYLAANSLQINSVLAQEITSDGTTDTTVSADGDNYTIQDGTRNGGNLFHSFQDFSVPNGGEAFFDNASDISNILSRVTGGNISTIDGLIRANDSANLFLINPEGIIFGSGARLDIGGSFYGSTADSILFEDGEFSAVNNLDAPILTINAPIGLNLRENPSPITNEAFTENSDGNFVGLEVLSGETLALIGGDVNFEAGDATAPGGQIELGGLANVGTVTIEPDGSLTFPESVSRANVTFTNDADVDVRATGGGSISVNANNIEISGGEFGGSSLSAGITADSTSADAQAGNIDLNATGTITINGESNIFNQVTSDGTGNAGNINIEGNSLSLSDGSQITAGVFGTGNAGTVTINALDTITFQGINSDGFPSGIINNVAEGGVGNAGDIEVATTNLNLIDGGTIDSSIFGAGNGGKITINASNAITLSGFTVFDEETTRFSSIRSLTDSNSPGSNNAGNIEINAGSFTLDDGAFLDSSTFGRGNAGQIQITSEGAVELAGDSRIFNNVEPGGVGDSQGVLINAQSLSVIEGSNIQTLVRGSTDDNSNFGVGNAGNVTLDIVESVIISGQGSNGFSSQINSQLDSGAEGNAGNIEINAGSFTLDEGAFLESSTSGQGNAGQIQITTEGAVELAGDSEIFNNVEPGGVGDSQGVFINAQSLSVTEGSQIQTLVRGSTEELDGEIGNAGNVIINAEENVLITGSNQDGNSSAIFSDINSGVQGNAGDIKINAASLTLSEGGFLESSTNGQGQAGNIAIDVDGAVNLTNNADIFSDVESDAIVEEGARSTVSINAASLSLEDGESSISTSTFGQGNAGNITLNINGAVEMVNGDIFSNVGRGAQGNGGLVTINAGSLSQIDGSQIQTSVLGAPEELDGGIGNAGNVIINAEENVLITGSNQDGNSSAIFSDINSGVQGNAGDIKINAASLTLSEGGFLESSTNGQGQAGNIAIDVDGAVNLTNNADIFSDVESDAIVEEGARSTVSINAASLSLEDGESSISTSTFGQGNAGNITLNIDNFIEMVDGDIFTSVVNTEAQGNGGIVNINTGSLALNSGAVINAGTFGEGDGGTISVNATESITLDGTTPDGQFSSGIGSSVEQGAIGQGGSIELTTSNLSVLNGAIINAGTFGEGNGGNISVNATESITLDGTTPDGQFGSGIYSTVAQGAIGQGGSIDLTTSNLSVLNGAAINAGTFGEGDGGTISIYASESITLDGTTPDGQFSSGIGSSVEQGAIGQGGSIEVTTSNLSILNGAGIFATTVGEGNGGSIIFNISDVLTLRENSTISTEASETNFNGGDIIINAEDGFVVAFPNQNEGNGNDIVTRSPAGQGGDIVINAQGLFGLEERSAIEGNGTNDIDASGIVSGNVEINVLNSDAIEGANQLPSNPVEARRTIAQVCSADRDTSDNNLTVIGRGGLAYEPSKPFNSEIININGETSSVKSPNSEYVQLISTGQGDITPAQGVEITEDGEIILTAYKTDNSSRDPKISTNCNQS